MNIKSTFCLISESHGPRDNNYKSIKILKKMRHMYFISLYSWYTYTAQLKAVSYLILKKIPDQQHNT